MADGDDRAAVAAEPVFEPDDRLDVEVVRGFVQHQVVRPLQQHLGQFDAHLPAAGELGGLAAEVLLREAQPLEHPLRFGFHGDAAHQREALGEVGEFLEHVRVGIGGVIGAHLHFLIELLQPVLHLLDVGEGGEGLLHHGIAGGQVHLLVQEAEGGAAFPLHLPFVGGDVPRDDLEHGGFARAVAAHEAHLVAGADGKGDPVEEDAVAVLLVNAGSGEHLVGEVGGLKEFGRKGTKDRSSAILRVAGLRPDGANG